MTPSHLTTGTVGMLFMLGSAHADFLGASLELIDDSDGLDTWRVYVDFDVSTLLELVGANDDTPPLVFESEAPLFNDGGQFDGEKRDDFPNYPLGHLRDSWVTVGGDEFVSPGYDFTPDFAGGDGFNSVIKGDSFSEAQGGWFKLFPPAQGTHILIAQFTVPSGANFSLSGNAAWGNPIGWSYFEVDTSPVECPADLDGSGDVGFDDLLTVLSTWGPCPGCPSDFDGSGDVGFDDLLTVLSTWGPCEEG